MSEDLLGLVEGLVIGGGRGGKKPVTSPTTFGFVRNLGEADLDLILNPRALNVSTPAVKRLNHSHHQLARMLAQGAKPAEASAATGYSPSRISTLQADPTFQNLVAYYGEQVKTAYVDVHERLAALGISSIEELQARLDENPDDFAIKDLLALAELTLDRSVAPPKSVNKSGAAGGRAVQVSISFPQAPQNPSKLIEGEAREISLVEVIEIDQG